MASVPHTPDDSGRRWTRWLAVLGAGLLVFLLPAPASVSAAGWRLLAIFVATVVGLIVQPLPMGAMAVLAITVAAVTKTVSAPVALSAFANPVIWLIVAAFLFARAVISTGLGRRIAYLFVRWFGSSTLRLGYALAGADFVVSPFIPSDTARAGGIIFPIARSLAEGYGSQPGPTARRLGTYLMQCAYHVGCTTAAVFLTSMAANPLAAEFAREFAGVEITWGRWALASSVPAGVSLLVLPWLIYRLDRPELERTPQAQQIALRELKQMGAMTAGEKRLLAVLLAVIAGWVAQPWHGLHPAIVAYAGISLLLLVGVMQWEDVLAERRAWDAFIWFGGLVMMADGLNQMGVIRAFTDALARPLSGLGPTTVLVVLVLAYVYLHYGFASMTAHITALYPAFLLLAVANGAPPLVSALALAFFSNLNASLTHYGTGPAPIFFGSGYVSLPTWWRVGFVVVLCHLVVWLGLGLLWWRWLGLW
ncbi:MAG: anion permease [Acidobacteriia bacterium]|jgi:DASS family divalent anion:Na+ symporter|nr:anion permease [Terriglobia bacterium]